MKRVSLSLTLAAGYCVAVAAIAMFAEISGGSLWAFIIYGATYPSILLVDRQVLVTPESFPVWASLAGVTLLNAAGVWLLTEAACRIVKAFRKKVADPGGTDNDRAAPGRV